MIENDVWAAIDVTRTRTADLLEQLSEDEWRRASLCEGWTVRDVAAHLTLQELTLGAAIATAFRHPGGVNRIIRESSRRRAALPTEVLIAQIRATVGHRRHNVGVTFQETLIDNLVHGQDIAIPLGRQLEMPTAAAAVAASRVWACRGTGKAKVFDSLPLGGYRFTATDTEWSAGDGPELTGPISALLLVLTGRPAGLGQLTGAGVEALTATVPARHDRTPLGRRGADRRK
ncbi:maleylpyruvate isomerase family mycothiol-dependent enzyme [Antrihabitans sp. YC3-6]|uniref:Maleylpyruvate isomerase family mycothiol-dependent enzyme n=1 Tax=Antrihabitans stalagmiti TaxID=2799499 RepID=A0A934NQJ0_9NOCA|nr:maleylpyruvate isomerase family mycothiol-dependent enzyme [Antrihabitans stalagmiti]MBJ8339460.1 maleylpyruvate isomerase family mycothiol-dependent enzyme [Antrihabitans stalagmiti]